MRNDENKYLLQKIGGNLAENEPLKLCKKLEQTEARARPGEHVADEHEHHPMIALETEAARAFYTFEIRKMYIKIVQQVPQIF